MNPNFLKALKDRFKDAEGGASPNVDEDIAQFKRHYRVRLPDDMRNFYASLSGKQTLGSNEEFTIWPLANVVPALDVFEDSETLPSGEINKLFVIADYMQCSWGYAISLEEACTRGTVYLIGTTPSRQIAKSFSTILSLLASSK